MIDRKSWFTRPATPAVNIDGIAEVIDYMTPDLQATLAGLHDAPPALATAVIQLLPFGSRAALGELGLVTCGLDSDATRRSVALTPLAYHVMAELSARAVADPGGVDEWTRLAQLAASRGMSASS